MNLIFKTLKTFKIKYRLLYASFFFVGLLKYFLEVLTLGSLLPLIAIISDSSNFADSKFGKPINSFFNYLGYNFDNQELFLFSMKMA